MLKKILIGAAIVGMLVGGYFVYDHYYGFSKVTLICETSQGTMTLTFVYKNVDDSLVKCIVCSKEQNKCEETSDTGIMAQLDAMSKVAVMLGACRPE